MYVGTATHHQVDLIGALFIIHLNLHPIGAALGKEAGLIERLSQDVHPTLIPAMVNSLVMSWATAASSVFNAPAVPHL
jgi:hypothetical protein